METRAEKRTAAIKFIFNQYRRHREKKAIPAKAYETIRSGILSFVSFAQNTILKPSDMEKQDLREVYCQKFSEWSEYITSENIVSILIELGEAADIIQRKQAESYLKSKSVFMEYTHGARQYLLYTFLGSLKEKNGDAEEKKIGECILKAQDEFKEKLKTQIEDLTKQQKEGCDATLSDTLNSRINTQRCHLAYVGYIDHLYNPNDRQTLYPPQYYDTDSGDPLKAFPSILQTRFAATLGRKIYKQMQEAQSTKDEKIITHHLEKDDDSIHYLEIEGLNQIDKEEKAALDLITKKKQEAEDAYNKMQHNRSFTKDAQTAKKSNPGENEKKAEFDVTKPKEDSDNKPHIESTFRKNSEPAKAFHQTADKKEVECDVTKPKVESDKPNIESTLPKSLTPTYIHHFSFSSSSSQSLHSSSLSNYFKKDEEAEVFTSPSNNESSFPLSNP